MENGTTLGVHLRGLGSRKAEADALAAFCGGRTGLKGMLGDLPRKARRSFKAGFKVHRTWRWDREDDRSSRWWPQGISTSADAGHDPEGRYEGREVITVAWYSKEEDGVAMGSRISFLDRESREYGHVLLVVPSLAEDGTLTVDTLHVHAGGMVWFGPYLYVAGTRKGLYAFHVDDLVRVPDEKFVDDDRAFGIQPDGRLATYGYRYLLPLRFRYHGRADEGFDRMRYSFLSLDRSGADGPELVAGEYGRGKASTRLARFPLDPATYRLRGTEDGSVRPLLLAADGVRGMQGACTVGGTWYATVSCGPTGLGTLCVGRPGRFKRYRWALPIGPEDIAYVPQTDTLWSVTEHPRRRWVFDVKRSKVS